MKKEEKSTYEVIFEVSESQCHFSIVPNEEKKLSGRMKEALHPGSFFPDHSVFFVQLQVETLNFSERHRPAHFLFTGRGDDIHCISVSYRSSHAPFPALWLIGGAVTVGISAILS